MDLIRTEYGTREFKDALYKDLGITHRKKMWDRMYLGFSDPQSYHDKRINLEKKFLDSHANEYAVIVKKLHQAGISLDEAKVLGVSTMKKIFKSDWDQIETFYPEKWLGRGITRLSKSSPYFDQQKTSGRVILRDPTDESKDGESEPAIVVTGSKSEDESATSSSVPIVRVPDDVELPLPLIPENLEPIPVVGKGADLDEMYGGTESDDESASVSNSGTSVISQESAGETVPSSQIPVPPPPPVPAPPAQPAAKKIESKPKVTQNEQNPRDELQNKIKEGVKLKKPKVLKNPPPGVLTDEAKKNPLLALTTSSKFTSMKKQAQVQDEDEENADDWDDEPAQQTEEQAVEEEQQPVFEDIMKPSDEIPDWTSEGGFDEDKADVAISAKKPVDGAQPEIILKYKGAEASLADIAVSDSYNREALLQVIEDLGYKWEQGRPSKEEETHMRQMIQFIYNQISKTKGLFKGDYFPNVRYNQLSYKARKSIANYLGKNIKSKADLDKAEGTPAKKSAAEKKKTPPKRVAKKAGKRAVQSKKAKEKEPVSDGDDDNDDSDDAPREKIVVPKKTGKKIFKKERGTRKAKDMAKKASKK